MTPEQFLLLMDPLPEPALLASADGRLLAGNRAAEQRFALPPRGTRASPLAEFLLDPSHDVLHYLRLCAGSRALVLGALTVRGRDGAPVACRAEGALVQPQPGSAAILLVRLLPKETAAHHFVLLNQRIDDLGREVHRRQRAEEAARQQQERLRVTLHSIGDAVIVTDPAGHVNLMNPVAEMLTGWSNAAAAGLPLETVFRIVNEETRHPVENPALRALREGVIVGLANHTVLLARDGTERPIDDSAAPIRDADGEVLGAVLVFRDITARREAERRVRASEQRFRLMADAAPVKIWITGPDQQFTWFNKRWLNFVGRPLEAELGDGWTEHVHPNELPHVLATFRAAFEARQPFSMEYHLRRHDGEYRWVLVTGLPHYDDGGRFTGYVGSCIDITDRRRAEESLRESEELFRTLADSIPQLAWMARPDGHIFWYNKRWYEYTGATPEQMAGWGWQSVHDPAVLPDVLARWKASIATGTPFDMVFPLRGADGRFRPFLTRVVPLKDRAGRVVQWFGTNTDISEQRAMEEALREEDRRKDEFLATLAHELRNPLAPIRNGLELMRLAAADPAAVQQVREMMERQLEHLIRLVDDLLDLSRISRGKIELRRERIDLAVIVRNALEAADPLIRQAGHQASVSLPDAPVYVDADRTRLAQALCNLLSNAAKYSEPGGRIWLSAAPEDGFAVIRVRDTGVGIPPHMLQRVFEMFTQVDRSLERAQGGLGIGLAIARRLVEMHGGTIHAHSEGPGKGSEFTVRLPVAGPPPAPRNAERPAAPPPPVCCRVLIADDNRDSADSLAMLLRVLGHEVCIAEDGQEAVEAAASFRPDVMLLDIGMPRLNGYDAARRVRQQPWGRGVMLVALTGWGQEEDKRKATEAGFDAHLVKPLDFAALEALLRDRPAR